MRLKVIQSNIDWDSKHTYFEFPYIYLSLKFSHLNLKFSHLLHNLTYKFRSKNDEIIINDSLYSPTRSYCEKILKKLGIKIKYFHPTKNINKFEKLITKQTKLIFLESPGTATFDIIDIPFITKIAKKYKIVTVCDNTWATPLFCQPFKLGINIIIDAGTKYISGHGDVLIGCVSSDKKHANFIRKTRC